MSSGVEVGRTVGHIRVSPRAVAGVAGTAILQCYGVVGIAARRLKGGRAQLLTEGNYERGIIVTMQGGAVVLDLYVVVEYGTRISEVAHNIITVVGESVRRALGDLPIRVNVNVQGLRISA